METINNILGLTIIIFIVANWLKLIYDVRFTTGDEKKSYFLILLIGVLNIVTSIITTVREWPDTIIEFWVNIFCGSILILILKKLYITLKENMRNSFQVFIRLIVLLTILTMITWLIDFI